MDQQDRFSSYQYCEGRTGNEQMVEFTCPPDVVEQVKEFLRTNIRTIDIPTTGRVSVAHGGYGQCTRYEIIQHDYAGGGYSGSGGYIEVLEVKNPPDGRWGIVINEYISYKGSVFTEWDSIENARAAFAKYWGSCDTAEKFPKLPGFKRRILCGALTPWFYAIGDEQLVGDYAFPEGLQDDAVYRFGRQFFVFNGDGIPMMKTCMGVRVVKLKSYDYPHNEYPSRFIYWDDGSVWNESEVRGVPPRPIEKGETWIVEAVQQFMQLLTGKSVEFTINFTDGNKFVGKLVKAKGHHFHCAEGDYFVVVHIKGEKELKEGWVNDFEPTKKAPDIVRYVTQRFARDGQEVEYVEIKERRTKKGGKKWFGAFFHPPR